MKKKLISVLLSAAMATTMLAGCGSTAADTGAAPAETKATEEKTEAADTEAETGTEEAAATGEGKVYYLNFKPEQADDWVALAEDYTAETGVPVTVVTAASGTYESTLKSEMAKTEAPTLFQVNGPVGLASWKDYCYDLKDSEVYKNVQSDDYVLKDGDAVQGIAYVIETYGLIYNKALLNDYFALDDAEIKSIDELNNFEALKKVADGIQAHKDDLGVEGAFALIPPLTGDLRHIWQTCLCTMNIRQTELPLLLLSREPIWTTTNRSSIFTSQILPVIRHCCPVRLVKMLPANLHLAKLSSTRMVPGLTTTSRITK